MTMRSIVLSASYDFGSYWDTHNPPLTFNVEKTPVVTGGSGSAYVDGYLQSIVPTPLNDRNLLATLHYDDADLLSASSGVVNYTFGVDYIYHDPNFGTIDIQGYYSFLLRRTTPCTLTASVVMNVVSGTVAGTAYSGGATGQAHGAYVAPLTFVWNITNNQTQQPVKTGQQDNQGLGGSQVEWSDTVGTVANPTTVTANLTITDSASPPCVATASGQYTTQPAPGSGGGSGGSGGGGGTGGGSGGSGGGGGTGGGTPGNPGGGAGGGGGGSGASVTGNPADPNAPGIGRGGQGLGIVSPDSTGTNIFSAPPTPTTELCAEPLT